MKAIILVGVLMTAISCGTQKKAQEEVKETMEAVVENYITGTVHVSEEGCKLYIYATENDKSIKMYPVNLEDKFQRDGMNIRFRYQRSRAMQPQGCDAEMVVSVTDVVPSVN